MKFTNNLNLCKPDTNDIGKNRFYNENSDIIDEVLGSATLIKYKKAKTSLTTIIPDGDANEIISRRVGNVVFVNFAVENIDGSAEKLVKSGESSAKLLVKPDESFYTSCIGYINGVTPTVLELEVSSTGALFISSTAENADSWNDITAVYGSFSFIVGGNIL